jgi:polyhydroxyalkanoate synthesis regulator phasin
MFINTDTLAFIRGPRSPCGSGRPTSTAGTTSTEDKEKTMPDLKIPDIDTDLARAARDIAAVAKDATYVLIGAGVLGYQQAQVQRQELLKRLAEPKADLEGRLSAVRTDLSGALHSVDATVEDFAERLEDIIERLEAAVAPLEDRLPTQARDVAKQAHVQAKEARTQLRSRIPTVAA